MPSSRSAVPSRPPPQEEPMSPDPSVPAGRPPEEAPGIRHGIVVVPEHRWREAAPRWAAAEQLGFAHAWTYDHLVWGGLPNAPVFAFAPTLALASTVTSTIGLGVFVA